MTKITTYKQEAYDQALAFRRRGFTYSEIAKICNVSRGTVSNWCKHEPFSIVVAADNKKRAAADNKKRIALVNKARVAERSIQYTQVLKSAETEFRHYVHSPLFVAGLTWYMAAGDLDTERPIRFSSQNEVAQQVFIRFVREFLGVSKSDIHIWLLLYPAHDEVACMKWWLRKTGLSAAQFYKNQVIPSRSSQTPLHFGVLNTIIGSTLLKKKLLRWGVLLRKELKHQ